MQAHQFNLWLTVSARDGITREEVLDDLRKQLTVIQEPAPYRSPHGATWWTNSDSAVSFLDDAGTSAAHPEMHKFTYDLWPADATDRSLPLRVAQFAPSPEEGMTMVALGYPEWEKITLSGHVRAQCRPAHPGVG